MTANTTPMVHSAARQHVVAAGERVGVTAAEVDGLLWAIGAEPDLHGLLRVVENLLEIVRVAMKYGLDGADSILRLSLDRIEALRNEWANDPLPTFRHGETAAPHERFPFDGICLLRSPLYPMLWCRPPSGPYQDRYRLLQFHLLSIHLDLLEREGIDVARYLHYDEKPWFLEWIGGPLNRACLAMRQWYQQEDDRLPHGAHRLVLRGESMRRGTDPLTDRDRSV
jgi:hypothetical protein